MSSHLYIIKGIVHPERAQLSIGPIELEFSHGTTGNQAKVKLNIVLNQITVLAHTDVEWDIFDLRNVIKQLVADYLAMVGYVKGYAYDVEIRQILNTEKDIDYVYGIDIPCIEERNKDKDLDDELRRITAHYHGENGVFVRRCLNDLVMAMRHPDDTAFYCFRAMESLKHYCRSRFQIEDEANQWKKLSELTGASKSDIEFIRVKAFPSRHGDVIGVSSKDRERMFLKTWDVVDEFLKNA